MVKLLKLLTMQKKLYLKDNKPLERPKLSYEQAYISMQSLYNTISTL